MNVNSRVANVYIVEEVEIYREFYKSIFSLDGPFKILDTVRNSNFQAIRLGLIKSQPDILFWGTKSLEGNIIKELVDIRKSLPCIGVLLMISNYNISSVQLLKELVVTGESGMAVFSRNSLQTVDQLYRILGSVSERQIILDPALSSVIFSEKQVPGFIKKLTQRELEILSLIAGGDTNSAIAETLYIDVKTVQHHITNIYGKILAETDMKNKHQRVSASRMYMENMGQLLIDHVVK